MRETKYEKKEKELSQKCKVICAIFLSKPHSFLSRDKHAVDKDWRKNLANFQIALAAGNLAGDMHRGILKVGHPVDSTWWVTFNVTSEGGLVCQSVLQ